jgi:hypothetical protein
MQMAEAVAKGDLSVLKGSRPLERQEMQLSLHTLRASMRSRTNTVVQTPSSPGTVKAATPLPQTQRTAAATHLIINVPPSGAEVQAERRRVLQASASLTDQTLQELHGRLDKNRSAFSLR